MSLPDGALGGGIGAEMTYIVRGLIERNGGVPGLVSKFEQQGLGGIIQSWIGTGANQPITADQIHQVLGSNAVAQITAKFGLNPQVLAHKLAQALPQAVDKMTAGGVVAGELNNRQ